MKYNNELTYQQALNVNNLLKGMFPKLLLTGSLALMIQDLLDKRPIGDLDYRLYSDNTNSINLSLMDLKMDGEYLGRDHNVYEFYMFSPYGYVKVNIFHYPERKIIDDAAVIDDIEGYLMISGKSIIEHKKKYNREKDQEDIKGLDF